MEKATIGIVGTGAVGGYLGGKLALAGNKVVFLSRGEALKKFQKDGLKLETKDGTTLIKDTVFTDDTSKLKDCQYILFTVKSYDTIEATNQIKDHLAKDALVITPQNGINNDLLIAEIIGKDRVIPALTKGGYTHPEPGHIANTSFALLIVGEYSGEKSARLDRFVKICQAAEIDTVLSEQIQVERWKKYVWNCTINIIAAISGLRVDQIIGDQKLLELCKATIREIIAVAAKEGVMLDESEIHKTAFSGKLGKFKPSTLQDVEKGKRTELEAFTGNLLQLAKKHNLNLPVNQTLYTLLHGIVDVKTNER